MKKMMLLFLLIFILSNVSASCNETQVNINSASLNDLDKIVNIGPSRAQQIVTLRPFVSVDDLIRIIGIGEATLAEIKTQGLACVENEAKSADIETIQKDEENNNEQLSRTVYARILSNLSAGYSGERGAINLTPANSKSIKSEENKKNLRTKTLALCGLIGLGVVLGVLFYIKKRKEKNGLQ